MSTPTKDDFHPDFARLDEREDVVLIAKEGTRFAVPKAALARASQWFSSMFSLPQPGDATNVEPIQMEETAETLHYVAAYACAGTLPDLASAAQIDAILRAVDKYEVPGLASVMRIALRNTSIHVRPVERYYLAARCGWEDIREEAQSACFMGPLDLDVPDDAFVLLKPLLDLRRRRCLEFNRQVDSLCDVATIPFTVMKRAGRLEASRAAEWFRTPACQALLWRLRCAFVDSPKADFILVSMATYTDWPAFGVHVYT